MNLNLNLKKPLVFLKVSTTGLEPVDKIDRMGDRITEVSIIKIEIDKSIKSHTKLINPGVPIPASAYKASGIDDSMVSNAPSFSDIAKDLYAFIGDSDIAGFNVSNFDVKFLTEEFNRAGIPFTIIGRNIVDVSSIYNSMEKRDFKSAAKKFTNTELNNGPISSETFNSLSVQILNGMIGTYSSDPRFQDTHPETLHNSFNRDRKSLDVGSRIVLNNNNRPVFNFGKYKGMLVSEIMMAEPNYYDWCLNVSDLPSDTKYIIRGITEKARSVKSQNA